MNKITQLFNIIFPIIQGGMIWCSGWELASAVSKLGFAIGNQTKANVTAPVW